MFAWDGNSRPAAAGGVGAQGFGTQSGVARWLASGVARASPSIGGGGVKGGRQQTVREHQKWFSRFRPFGF
jgi:hypothetical protein